MRKTGFTLALALFGATSAFAGNATTEKHRVIACYKEVKVGAQYSVKKVLVKKAKRVYLKRGDLIQLVEYPAVYREDKKLIKPAHVVMKEIPCKKG
ncbi:MAG: hypothetical protein N4A70_05390 [Pelagimonas sp.]|jgi:hypothetical protein|nr:hypothetical protein [Pelagimonas sp.]